MHEPLGSFHFELYNIHDFLLASESITIHAMQPVICHNFNFNLFQGIYETIYMTYETLYINHDLSVLMHLYEYSLLQHYCGILT